MNKINKYYSYSQINTFLNCPKKYKLIYIDKILIKKESIEGFIGKVVHEVLEWIYKEKSNFLIWDKIENKYFEFWIKRWHSEIFYFNKKMLFDKNKKNYKSFNQKHFKKIGLEYLRNYYIASGGPNLNFDSVIGVESTLYTKINGYTFKVIIDRIDKTKDGIHIYDYKTGKSKSKTILNNDIQLPIYQIALEQKYPKQKIYLNWHFLKEKDKEKYHIRISKDKNEINKIKLKITNTINEIKKNKATQDNQLQFSAKTSFLCNWCYLWEYCDAKTEYNEKNNSLNVE